MNTSTKLFIFLVISVPITMFTYNWLLAKEYKEANLTINYWTNPPERDTVILPSYRHIVMDGRLHSKEGTLRPRDLALTVQAAGEHETPSLSMPPHAFKNLRSKVSNDTLYISFYKEHISIDDDPGYIPWDWFSIILRTPEINSAKFLHGNYLIGDTKPSDNFDIRTEYANLDVNNMHVKNLNVVTKSSVIHFHPTVQVDNLTYSITDEHCEINFHDKTAKTYTPGIIHPDARVVLKGKADDMRKYIVPIP